jgi:O-antigen/teichoic acid export membrane protein
VTAPAGPRKFTRDVQWNVAGLAVAGVCGVALSYLVGVVYGAAALGVFNLVFAAWIFFSQLAALGVHYSALRQVASTDDPTERAAATTSALAATVLLAAGASAFFVAAAPAVAGLMDSPDVGRGMRWAAPGLFLFALNKVLLGSLNGARRMGWYALFQGGRFVLMLAALGVCAALAVDRSVLPVVLTVAEGGILLGALVPARDLLRRLGAADLWRRAREHLEFGVRGFGSGLLSELNTRVDVLMLGLFTSDAVVGVYSLAAVVAEGLYQLLVVLRTNYTPILARLWARGERAELLRVVRRGRNLTYLAALPAGALAAGGYALIVPAIVGDPALSASVPVFAILVAGIVSCAGYAPFLQLPLAARQPGRYTVLMLFVVAVNVVANAALIPLWGALGAATATAIAFAASALFLVAMARGLLRLPI